MCVFNTFRSRVCGVPFDDPKGRWRTGGGINVPVIVQLETCRSQVLRIKEELRLPGAGITVTLEGLETRPEN